MQTKRIEVGGQAKYVKKEGYKPLKNSRNMWFFHDRQTLICQQVYQLGMSYYERMQDPKLRPRHRIGNPAQLVKLFYWLFLTGARQQEAFKEPCKLDIVNKDGGTYVTITHVNQKHPPHRGDIVTQTMPIFDEFEQKMWNFITEGGQETEAEHIFKYNTWKSTRNSNITALFKKNFITTLQSPDGKVHRNAGIAPHILRHMRTFNILNNHRVPRSLAQLWMGWDSQYMLDYYEHIRSVMSVEGQIKALEQNGLLTKLRIDAGRMFTTG